MRCPRRWAPDERHTADDRRADAASYRRGGTTDGGDDKDAATGSSSGLLAPSGRQAAALIWRACSARQKSWCASVWGAGGLYQVPPPRRDKRAGQGIDLREMVVSTNLCVDHLSTKSASDRVDGFLAGGAGGELVGAVEGYLSLGSGSFC